MKRLFLIVALASFFPALANADGAIHDSHELTAQEEKIFIPLVCAKPTPAKKEVRDSGYSYTCATLINYPDDGEPVAPTADFVPLAIAYGDFSGTKVDEAYLSYRSNWESHANNFGGGVLFRRTDGRWKVVRWYIGKYLSDCVALPDTVPQKMLCLGSFMNYETDATWIAVDSLGDDENRAVLAAEGHVFDEYDPDKFKKQCSKGDTDKLLEIKNLRRSQKQGVFAEATVTYMTKKDYNNVCQNDGIDWGEKEYPEVDVQFIFKNNTVVPVFPPNFPVHVPPFM